MTPHLQKLVDDWQLEIGQRGTFLNILDRPTREAVAVLLQILHEETDPRLKLRVLNEWEKWLHELQPQLFRNLTTETVGPVPATATNATHAEALEQQVKMNDAIQLRALSQEGQAKLDRWGTWWRVIQAYDYDRSKPAPSTGVNRPPSWFLKSLTRKEQGLAAIPADKKHPNEMQWLCKEGDPSYAIVNICAFPKTFKHQDYVPAK